MRNALLPLMLVVATNMTLAQQKYQTFNIHGKYGITDTLGNEALKPSYKYVTAIPAKNQIYLQDFSDKSDIIFNTKTGTKQFYESVYNDKILIANVPYSIINNKGKKFLLSEETDKTIALTRDYSDFYNVGQYIVARYYAQDPLVPGGKDKNGNLLPPKIRELKRHYVVLSNDETLKTVVDKKFDTYLPLYKIEEKEEEKDEEMVSVVEIVLTSPIRESRPIFDFIVLSQGNNHTLYNAQMRLIKTFVLKEADEEMLLEFCKKTLGTTLDTRPTHSSGMMINAAPMMAPSRQSPTQPETKKPFKPYFYIKKLDNGITIFALQETEEISKRIFEANVNTKVRLNDRDCAITIHVDGKEDGSLFHYNPKTGKIYLPKEYLPKLGITLL